MSVEGSEAPNISDLTADQMGTLWASAILRMVEDGVLDPIDGYMMIENIENRLGLEGPDSTADEPLGGIDPNTNQGA